MGVIIRIPAALRVVAGGRAELEVQAGTVRGALEEAIARCPALRRHLYGEDGRLRSYVNVYVNEDDIRWGGGESRGVGDGDVITIVPSIAGG
ncbi:MAG TPA: MoaD/ThiS family protein [Longimicrobiales bacterium]